VGDELLHADKRTDRHDEADSRFSQICESAWKMSYAEKAKIMNKLGNIVTT
jgi:hypothetical protein